MAISHAVREASTGVATCDFPVGIPMVRHHRRSYVITKRALDVVVSGISLILLAPAFAIISLCVAATGGFPVLYRQPRVGRGGKTIHVLKFRTMVRDAESMLESDSDLRRAYERNFKLKDDPRVTRLGKFLRKTSLDELPQLLNVFLGDMSLVGPRPIIAKELPRYGEASAKYLAMTPGCAGIWQCSGRNEVEYERRVEMDVDYYWKASLAFDSCLVFRTFIAVLTRRGAC